MQRAAGPSRSFAVVFLAFALAGCTPTRPRAEQATSLPARPSLVALAEGGCAPPDRRILELGARIGALRDAEGYYAVEALRNAVADRDALLRGVLARRRAALACARPGEVDPWLEASARALRAIAGGADPGDLREPVVVHDYRGRPRAMPFVARACSGYGFEGAAQCLVLVLPAGLADIATLPLGTWFWAGPPKVVSVPLATMPLPPDIARDLGDLPKSEDPAPRPAE